MEHERGDGDSFDLNWKNREEGHYIHWTKGEITNQVQLAFRNHWEVFQIILTNKLFNQGKRVLEVGCGRGSLSAYFCDAGYDCTLLDISETSITLAKKIFQKNSLDAAFIVGDANNLDFSDKSFDIIFSIGLLEHFQDINKTMEEQIRVLDDGGIFFGYIVPEKRCQVQEEYKWVNDILTGYHQSNIEDITPKIDVFRNIYNSSVYTQKLQELGLKDIGSSGIYSLPMISHSIEFPFSLMPAKSELALVNFLNKILQDRRKSNFPHPWLCEEEYGQAFLVWGFKHD